MERRKSIESRNRGSAVEMRVVMGSRGDVTCNEEECDAEISERERGEVEWVSGRRRTCGVSRSAMIGKAAPSLLRRWQGPPLGFDWY